MCDDGQILQGFWSFVFFRYAAWTFLAIGTSVATFLSVVLFSVTVVVMPMLLDRENDLVTAMLTAVGVVTEHPVVMLIWGRPSQSPCCF
ncbi:MAG: DUF2189 domain-containing protein [Roseobacter sp.]